MRWVHALARALRGADFARPTHSVLWSALTGGVEWHAAALRRIGYVPAARGEEFDALWGLGQTWFFVATAPVRTLERHTLWAPAWVLAVVAAHPRDSRHDFARDLARLLYSATTDEAARLDALWALGGPAAVIAALDAAP